MTPPFAAREEAFKYTLGVLAIAFLAVLMVLRGATLAGVDASGPFKDRRPEAAMTIVKCIDALIADARNSTAPHHICNHCPDCTRHSGGPEDYGLFGSSCLAGRAEFRSCEDRPRTLFRGLSPLARVKLIDSPSRAPPSVPYVRLSSRRGASSETSRLQAVSRA